MMVDQFEFDFGSPEIGEQSVGAADSGSRAAAGGRRMTRGRARSLLQRAVVRWLEEVDSPTGVALGVNTRVKRFRADVAAFWSRPVRNPHQEGPRQILRPQRSMIVQCFVERDDCWPDFARTQRLIPLLEEKKRALRKAEEDVRHTEPELRDGNVLFEEYAEWRYEDSRNMDYHRIQREIHNLERSLLHGTAFEQICSAEVADQLLLAVPAGVVCAEEMADGWGLLWVHEDLRISVEKGPVTRDCIPENRRHLVQNIGAAAKRAALFTAGVAPRRDGSAVLVQPPRGHRRRKDFRLQ